MQQALIKIIIFSLLFIALPTPRTATAAVLARPPSNLGLVGYWNFDEGVGTVAGDSSGNGNNGTITGATWTDGKRGKALSFDGVLGHVSIGTGNTYFPLQTFTICTWVKSPGLASGMSSNGIIGITYGLTFYLSNQGHFVTTIDNGIGADYVTISENLYDNKYHNLCLTFDGTQRHMYIDGILKDSRNQTWLGTTRWSFNEAVIGRNPNNWSVTKFNGSIDDVRIYNRALSSGEIARLYSSGQATRKTVSNQGLVGYWSFDEGAGTVAGDSSGNQMTATLLPSLTGWNNGKRGKALDVKEGHGADVANNSALNIADNLTVSLWLKARADHGGYAVHPVNKWTNTTDANYVLYYFGTTSGLNRRIQFYGNRGGNWGSISGSHIIDLDRWYHVTLEYNSTTGGQLYIDGQAVGTRNSSGVLSTNNNILRMGRFDGLIDDLRIYNRSLSAGEIQKLYEQSSATINSSQNNKMTDGLVGLWSFDGKDISGTTAYDRSGQGNNGTITGAKPTIGKIGQALVFGGNGDNVKTSTINHNIGTGNFTWSVWFKSTGLTGDPTGSTLLSMGNYSPWFGVSKTTGRLHIYWNGYNTFTNAIQVGEWYHLVLKRENGIIYSYINGVVDPTTFNMSTSMSNNIAVIGASNLSTTIDFTNGAVDDVRIYNRALSAEEVKQLYLMGK